jgi:hypothetical protein
MDYVRHNVPVSKRLTAILASLVVALVSCNRGHSPVTQRREMGAAEYEVLTAWIDATFTGKERVGKGVERVVIFDTTQSGDDELLGDENGQRIPWARTAESLRKKDPALQQSALDAFRKVNTQQEFLRHSFRPSIDYELVTSAQLEPIFCKHCGFWPAYYKQYPGSQGLLEFSGVGFSADGTQAFFYFSNRCEGLCGTGDYVVMEKREGRWVIQQDIEMWVS